jgi:hypothetical protein
MPNSSPARLSRPTSSRRRALAAIAVMATSLTLFQLPGCRAVSHWEPYADTTGDEVRIQAELARAVSADGRPDEGGCATCHDGCSDPHPGGRKSTCTHCHGGDATATTVAGAHPAPLFPREWARSRNTDPKNAGAFDSANPERPYTLTLKESEAWIRFVNPGDLRVANKTCGPCHAEVTLQVMKSLMATAQHFWGTVTYANGIVSNKRSIFGESFGADGSPQVIRHLVTAAGGERSNPSEPGRMPTPEELQANSWSAVAAPLPHWEVTQPGNVFRIFERGSRLGTVGLGQNGLPSPVPGIPDKLEDPGRPNNKSSDRGLGTLNRVDLPTLNVHKTRLNDPHLGMFGTNDQPGDFRGSGCTACHMVYANDRDPVHSGPYAQFGNKGFGNVGARNPYAPQQASDPTIAQDRQGHPIAHRFTTAIPSSQCMVCHMHQPNSFLNTYYGYQMWSYETDGDVMWPPEQREKSHAEVRAINDRNPEGAAARGKWGDRSVLDDVADAVNPKLKHTQFADYHGHGWIFRAVFKMDRKGRLLDGDGNVVDYDDPKKFEGVIPKLGWAPTAADFARKCFTPPPGKPVHLKDIHAERGMHCVDCHFAQDVHGDTHLYSEYQAAIQIQCQDCHGTATDVVVLDESTYSGPAAKKGKGLAGTTPWGKKRFEEVSSGGEVALIQRSMLYPDLTWRVKQVKDTVTLGHADYNEQAAYAKLQTKADGSCAHAPEKMDCAACHTSWMTSCFGCHLPQEANWRTDMHHFEDKSLRNWASYNPQVARDDVFMLGISPAVKDNKVAAVRSSSAVMVSSTDSQRAIAYKQQLTVAANGMNGQCFNTHFAHTVRTKETRGCSDCHVSDKDDNNAWLAQTYLMGTNYVNFFGMYAYVGGAEGGLEAVKITEWPEPQAMIGSNLHRMAFPAEHAAHEQAGGALQESHHHSGNVLSLEQRGEYLYTANGAGGFRVYDIANVANKNFSERIVTAPVSPLGQDTHVATRHATAVALPTNMSISMGRPWIKENLEQNYPYKGRDQNLHESYRYAYVSDRFEGLVLVDIDCLTDGDPDNNFTKAAVRFNPGGALDGAENLAIAGTTVYVCCKQGLVAVSVADPLAPQILSVVPMSQPTAVAVQFRYAFVATARGLEVVDVTHPAKMKATGAVAPIDGARDVAVARTYAYVAAGSKGIAIVDVTAPAAPGAPMFWNGDGKLKDTRAVRVGMVNDSVYAVVADGSNGMHVCSLVTPEDGRKASSYGFAPEPMPKWLASRSTSGTAVAIAKGLERDRAVDESGHQVSVFGRIGGRPFTLAEMQRLYLDANGDVRKFADKPPKGWTPKPLPTKRKK